MAKYEVQPATAGSMDARHRQSLTSVAEPFDCVRVLRIDVEYVNATGATCANSNQRAGVTSPKIDDEIRNGSRVFETVSNRRALVEVTREACDALVSEPKGAIQCTSTDVGRDRLPLGAAGACSLRLLKMVIKFALLIHLLSLRAARQPPRGSLLFVRRPTAAARLLTYLDGG